MAYQEIIKDLNERSESNRNISNYFLGEGCRGCNPMQLIFGLGHAVVSYRERKAAESLSKAQESSPFLKKTSVK